MPISAVSSAITSAILPPNSQQAQQNGDPAGAQQAHRGHGHGHHGHGAKPAAAAQPAPTDAAAGSNNIVDVTV